MADRSNDQLVRRSVFCVRKTFLSDAVHKIAFQGVPGAYSHMSCQAVKPDMEAVACASFEDMLNEVQEDRAELAMVPVENSIAGRVADIHHLLPSSGLYITGEHFQRELTITSWHRGGLNWKI